MIIPKTIEELALYVEEGNNVFFFAADWCGDCQFIYPVMPEIEGLFPEFRFVQVDRDVFTTIASKWGIYGIPSFIVTRDGRELGRLVNKKRKTKIEIIDFLKSIKK